MGLLTSFTRPSLINPTYLETVPWQVVTTANTAGANTLIAQRLVMPCSGQITKLEFFVAATSGNVDAGIYEWDGSADFDALWRAGSTAAASANSIQSFTPNVARAAGQAIWVVVAADNGTLTLARPGAGTLSNISAAIEPATTPPVAFGKGSSFPLSAAITESGVSAPGSVLPWVRLTIT